jgi:antitoxin (DNA-binding transcriptional repressor) of toxin-antitoxin stability system
MNTITLAELQQHPDPLLDRIRTGERLLLVRDGEPIAELRPVDRAAPGLPRPRGLCAGQFVVPADFDAPLPEDVLRDFEGG